MNTQTAVRTAPNPNAAPTEAAQAVEAPKLQPQAPEASKPEPQPAAAPAPAASTEVAVRRPQEIRPVEHKIGMFDTARFEHMGRVANAMATNSLLPEALTHWKNPDSNQLIPLPFDTVRANCLLIVNQAFNWEMDVFAVASSVSVVKGKLCYEGKLVAAVIDAKLGVKLHYHFIGDPSTEAYRIYLSDRPYTPDVLKQLDRASVRIPGWRLWDGSVAEWRTSGNGSAWGMAKNWPRMLIYRGTRDWTRIYESALMLGVYTDDEIEEDRRFERARVVSPPAAAAVEQPAVRRAPNPNAPVEVASEVVEGEIVADEIAVQAAFDRLVSKTPNPEINAAEFLVWLEDRLAECDADVLQDTWNDSLALHVERLPVEYREDAMGLYRKRERELESAPGEDVEEDAEKIELRLFEEIEALPTRVAAIQWTMKPETKAARTKLTKQQNDRLDAALNRRNADLRKAERA